MESFFQISASFTYAQLIDFLIKRYGNIDYLLHLDFSDFFELLKVACDKTKEEQARNQWLCLYPWMVMKHVKTMSAEEYIDQATGRNIDNRPVEVIMKDIEEARKRAERK